MSFSGNPNSAYANLAGVHRRHAGPFGARTAPPQTPAAPKKPSRLLAFAGTFLLFLSALSLHANSDLVEIADREITRRQQNISRAEDLITRAERAVAEKNLSAAYSDYLAAVEILPAGVATESEREKALADFSSTAVDYANWLIARGEFGQAEEVAKTVLRQDLNPTYKPAMRILARLERPGYFNKTVDPVFAEKRDEVSKLLSQAQGYFATGRLDLAMKRYEQVLNLDPYNVAARKGMEQVNGQRTEYYEEAYNQTRSEMLWKVDSAWERPVRKLGRARSTDSATEMAVEAKRSKDAIIKKLNSIVVDNVDLSDVSIREAVDFLKRKSKELDPEGQGVNLVLKLSQPVLPTVESGDLTGETADAAVSEPLVTEQSRITMNLKNVPLVEAIRYLTELSQLKYKIDPFAVSLVPVTENTEELFTKEYRVSPSFIPATEAADSAAPVAGSQGTEDSNVRIKGTRDATAFLEGQGIPFPKDAYARYSIAGSKLIVRNTQANLDTIDVLVEGDVGTKPTQVEIESRFVEINQTNLNELGFDWLLGPFDIGGGVYGDGGTRAGNQPLSQDYYANFPFGSVGTNPVTSGNRNGFGTSPNSAITANSINALLAGLPQGANVASPGIFGIAGVFTNPQFQVVIRALSQQKGVDLMTAPKVTTKSGVKAVVKITREFPYPSEFDPPGLPQLTSTGGGNEILALPSGSIISGGVVTPSSPTAFEKKDLGVILEVEPQVGADNYTIELSLKPEVIDFDGFVNYGSPIYNYIFNQAVAVNPLNTGIERVVATENVINQPVFSVRRVETNVSIWDGQTVAMGGLIREDVQKVDDKVPILGDIPLAGRLFRSNVDQKIKKNLIIFVTARLMDPEGKALQQQDESEDMVEPLGLPEDLPPPTVSTTRSLK